MGDLNGGQKVGALAVVWLFGAIMLSMVIYGLDSATAQGWSLVALAIALATVSEEILRNRRGGDANAEQREKAKRADADPAALMALLTDEDRAALSASVRQRLVRRLADEAPTDGELSALEGMLADDAARRARR